MMTSIKTSGLMLATGLATLAAAQPAMALDAEAFVDRIETVYRVMGYDLSFGPATLDGDTVTVDGLTFAVTGAGEEPIDIDTELTFTGVTENEDGSYWADELTVPDVDTQFADEPVGHVTLTDIVMQDIWLPPEGETGSQFLLQSAGRVATGPLTVTRDGEQVFAYESLDYTSEFTFDDAEELESLTTDFAINGIDLDLTTVSEEDPQAGAMIESLALTQVNGNITQKLDWTMADGRLNMSEFLFDFADVGSLDIVMDVAGFTPEFLDKLYAMQASDIDPESEEGQAQQMMLGMEMAQAMIVHSASIRYDDAGLAGKALDTVAEQQGVERAQFVEAIKPTIPALVNQAGIPPLTDLVVPAVEAFLDNPESFEIAVQPASPTSLLVLAAAAANPAGLVQALGLTIEANQ